MKRFTLIFGLLVAVTCLGAFASSAPLLLQTPTLSKSQIVFAYADDLWSVGRNGGEAHRLAAGLGREASPVFSPDGKWIAFSADQNDNVDVYVIPAEGGQATRLTYHPGRDEAVGWTPDGKRVLFRSHRDSANDPDQLYTVSVAGGMPTVLPLPMAEAGSYSPNGAEIAYSPVFQWEPDWKKYRGGQTTPIWIARLSDSSIVKIPRDNSNDKDPMWVGDKVYFVSDRDGAATLFSYEVETHKVAKILDNDGFDIDSASAGPGAIVYSQMGELHLFNLASGTEHRVPIEVHADLPGLRPHFEKVSDQIRNPAISPTGVRAVFEAHGDILTVPGKKGDSRNLTQSPGAADRSPAWSPDGRSIAYFSDRTGNYALYIEGQDGLSKARGIDLGQPPSFFYRPTWSPDGKNIAYTDKRLNLWYLSLDHPTPIKVDTDLFDTPLHEFDEVWSPDSRWIAYTKQLHNHQRAVFVYSLATGKSTQITDGMSDCLYPAFDKSGKYLFFTASTDLGLSTGWLDMSSEAHPVTRSVYVAVLRKDLPSPLKPESDEEKAQDEKSEKKNGENGKTAGSEKEGSTPKPVEIDFEGILQRTLALPIPAANYVGMTAGEAGILFLEEAPIVGQPGPKGLEVLKFDLKERKVEPLLSGVRSGLVVSADGKKMLYRHGRDWYINATSVSPKPGEGKLETADLRVRVDPRQEWHQMYREVWRIERDFFYDPHFHGLDLPRAEAVFAPYVDGIASREDLNYLFRKMLSYMSVGHMFVRGGWYPKSNSVHVGLLGASYTVENGRYRISKIFRGENWNPQLQAPLTQPGIDVKVGDYLLAVNGRQIHAPDNLYSFFQETAGKQTVIEVGPNADGHGAHEVTVVPIESETRLRHLAWIDANRREVDRLSGGRLAYVYLPDTAHGGFTNFNRYYFAQVGKKGAILDERFNHGGQLADYIIDALKRPVMSRVATREGDDYSEPTEAIYGPKAMIINQFAGSGGDAMPWYFRKAGIGPLIGHRTWGGLVGIGGYPPLIDGGRVTAPRWAIYGLNGHWEVENHGIAPDFPVWQDPALVRKGHDPQLEKAVQVLLEELKRHPLPHYQRPPYPNYHPSLPAPKSGSGQAGAVSGPR